MNYQSYLLMFFGSLGLVLVIMPILLPFLHKLKYGQTVSEYMPSQAKKNGTPTMGGIVFIVAPILMTIIFFSRSFNNMKFILVMLAFVFYGLIGFIDDYIIVVQKNNKGLSPRMKFMLQLFLAIIFYMMFQSFISTDVLIPFINISVPFGNLYILLVLLLFTATSNAVNLTDGMDGLAAGTSMIALIPFLFLAIKQGESEIAIFIIGVIAALIGYLKFNYIPAKIFMGDAGALALGGLLAALSLVLKCELALIIIGGVFVMETASVILQVASVKIRHKRILKCSPIHYHFEQSGMSEKQVIWMFYGMGLICALIGFFII